MSGCASSSGSACPSRSSTRARRGSTRTSAGVRVVPREHLHVTLAFLGHRPAGELDAIVGALREAAAAAGPDLRLAVGRYRETRSVAMLVLEDVGGGATALAEDVQARLEALGVYRREGQALAAAPHGGPLQGPSGPPARAAAPRRADGNVCSVRRGCLPVTTASRRGAVRRTGVDPPSTT